MLIDTVSRARTAFWQHAAPNTRSCVRRAFSRWVNLGNGLELQCDAVSSKVWNPMRHYLAAAPPTMHQQPQPLSCNSVGACTWTLIIFAFESCPHPHGKTRAKQFARTIDRAFSARTNRCACACSQVVDSAFAARHFKQGGDQAKAALDLCTTCLGQVRRAYPSALFPSP